MKYLTAKFLAASLLVLGSFSQKITNPNDPSLGWDEFKQLKCADGYNKVSNFCVKCNTTGGMFFDPVTKQCRKCPAGTKFNAASQSCDCDCAPPRQINQITKICECSGERVLQNNQCVCPDSKPLWNGRACVACPPGTNFEPKDKQCYNCPEGFILDSATHQCRPGL